MSRQVVLAAQPQPVVWTEDGTRAAVYSGGVFQESQAAAAYSLMADVGAFVLTGRDVSFIAPVQARQFAIQSFPTPLFITASADRVAAYGTALVVETTPAVGAKVLNAQTGTFVLTGQAANLAKTGFTADRGTFVLSGQPVALAHGYRLTAAHGTFIYTLAGVIQTMEAFTGSFGLSGQSVELIYTPATTKLVAAGGLFVLSGQDASLTKETALTAARGTFVLTGQAVNFKIANLTITASTGVFTLTGRPTGNRLRAEAGAFVLTGMAADLELNADTFWTRVDETPEIWTRVSA